MTAPTREAAHEMGANGSPAVEAERLAFEAWMKGHCWSLCATWRGTQYQSDSEVGGRLDPFAMRTRELWAAWRDRAALAFAAGQSSCAGSGAELVREVTAPTKLPQAVLDFDDFLNEPPSDEGERRVREYRHEAYRKWGPVLDAIRAALLSGDAAREDAERLDFYESHPAAIGHVRGRYAGSYGPVAAWYSVENGCITGAATLRAAIDRARGGK